MMRGIFILFATAVTIFSVTSANAMQLNLTLGNDIKNNQYPLNIAYNIYYANGSGPFDKAQETQHLDGLTQERAVDFVAMFNQVMANKHPVNNYDGKHSSLMLGFNKNGTNVYPASCQDIKLQDINNVTLTETGCIVS